MSLFLIFVVLTRNQCTESLPAGTSVTWTTSLQISRPGSEDVPFSLKNRSLSIEPYFILI
jgi:hypothetical protein